MALSVLQDGNGLSSGRIRLSPREKLLRLIHDRFDGEGMGAMVMKVRGRIEAEPSGSPSRTCQRRHLRVRRDRPRRPWTPLPRSDGAPSGAEWDVRVFSVQETMAFVRRCRQGKTSLDGALFAAAVFALRAFASAVGAAFQTGVSDDPRPEPAVAARHREGEAAWR